MLMRAAGVASRRELHGTCWIKHSETHYPHGAERDSAKLRASSETHRLAASVSLVLLSTARASQSPGRQAASLPVEREVGPLSPRTP